MEQEITINLADLTDHELLVIWRGYQKEADEAKEMQGRAEMELTRRMNDLGATAIPDPEFDCHFTYTTVVDYDVLAQLREVLEPAVIGDAYSPAHQDVVDVDEKWNMTKVNALKKYGDNIKAIIAASKKQGKPSLKVTVKE